jgi:glycogen operon protein
MLLDGRAQPTGLKRRGQDATMLVVLNAHYEAVTFTLPAGGEEQTGAVWRLLLDTQVDAPAQADHSHEYEAGAAYAVAPRSLLLLILKSAVATPPPS